jgi:coenzyme F420-dependent glucose-6-phosphate dehydrogenase
MEIGFHASHEQFAPSHLLKLVKLAEEAGFDCAKSSDHFHPWSERQGQSGFAWAWLGAVMQSTQLPMGIISAPGYRYHPAVLAQAAATLAEMFPERLWLALGSGEAINEAITGQYWPDKAERNARLLESAGIIRALLAGETVTHRGRVEVTEAKLYSRPAKPIPLYGAAVSEETAAFVGQWADGLLTAGSDAETMSRVIGRFRDKTGDRPVHVQLAISWAETESEALSAALDQWSACVAGGEVSWDLRRPADFDRVAQFVSEDLIRKSVRVTADPQRIKSWIEEADALGVDVLHLHNVGRNQEAFIEMFSRHIAKS